MPQEAEITKQGENIEDLASFSLVVAPFDRQGGTMNVISADDLDDAAQKIVKAVKGN